MQDNINSKWKEDILFLIPLFLHRTKFFQIKIKLDILHIKVN